MEYTVEELREQRDLAVRTASLISKRNVELHKALSVVRAELDNGVTANWDFIDQTISRALSHPPAKEWA